MMRGAELNTTMTTVLQEQTHEIRKGGSSKKIVRFEIAKRGGQDHGQQM